ncbi:hypothetical protein MMARJ_13880 [Mycobacterium marseillense]|uniref:Transposase n=1 Tax=Mycobacterium marseillense TaxID=701042 RepID=A0ABM7J9W8_9MYCO|nr:hypothetical protein MMARJ_13880 [Mycobacterium marseillense]
MLGVKHECVTNGRFRRYKSCGGRFTAAETNGSELAADNQIIVAIAAAAARPLERFVVKSDLKSDGTSGDVEPRTAVGRRRQRLRTAEHRDSLIGQIYKCW